jgi:hypothetical protein
LSEAAFQESEPREGRLEKNAYRAPSSGQQAFWWFAWPERSAQLARKTGVLMAKIAGD